MLAYRSPQATMRTLLFYTERNEQKPHIYRLIACSTYLKRNIVPSISVEQEYPKHYGFQMRLCCRIHIHIYTQRIAGLRFFCNDVSSGGQTPPCLRRLAGNTFSRLSNIIVLLLHCNNKAIHHHFKGIACNGSVCLENASIY